MNITKKNVFELTQDIPSLEGSEEGQLRGGFVSFSNDTEDAILENINVNIAKGCSCSCDKNKSKCTEKTTETTEDTTTENSLSCGGLMTSSMLF